MAVQSYGASDVYASHPEKKASLYFIGLGFLAMLIGTLFGPFQALNYGGVNAYPFLQKILPFVKSYYQGLTLHGVLNAIVFTQFFIQGLLLYLPARDLNIRPQMALVWAAVWLDVIGLVMAAIPLLGDNATVLYTFYPPLQGHWAFYVGAALIIVSSLVSVVVMVEMWMRWKKSHPGQITPLVAYMSLLTWLMWGLASLGLVVEAVFFLIPWSLGLIKGVDPLLARTLFWYSGHPIVYFWLLPAYVSWYGLVPRQAGGKLASDPLARLAFLLFLLFSVPVGFHHQFADPGIPSSWKMVHTVLTMLVAVPSMITAFTMAASLEYAGRLRGGKGVLGWVNKLPWRNPSVTAQLLAMIAFIIGGAGGIVNASFNLDLIVHNTAWIPGHFHTTVGTAVALSFMGIAFWLVPHLTRKPLVAPNLALLSSVLWFVGMMLMAVGMHWQGLLGVPRRAQISALEGAYTDQSLQMFFNILAGVILFLAAAFFFYVLFATLLQSKRVSEDEAPIIPFTQVLSGPDDSPGVKLMERVWLWFGIAVLLVVLSYGPMLWQMFTNQTPVPGMRLW